MNTEFYFDQKKYISTKRGATISGYMADYIGQLCRAGKIDCRQVGRVWFVNEESILNHQKIAAQKIRGSIMFPPIPAAEMKKMQTAGGYVELTQLTGSMAKQIGFMVSLVSAVLLIVVFSFVLTQSRTQNQFVSFGENTVMQTASVPDTFSVVGNTLYSVYLKTKLVSSNLALDVYRSISGLFNYNNQRTYVVRTEQPTMNSADDVSYDAGVVTERGDRSGLVVVPSTGDSVSDEKIKQDIKNSFSDETEVVFDDTGTSGVIKPVFKKSTDQEYLYVMVPLGGGQ